VEKLLFLFGRKPGLSRDEFARHYLDVHAPLGLRVTRAMTRYVVNLVEPDQRGLAVTGMQGVEPPALDAITEIWTPSVEAFFDPERAFVSAEAGRELMADHTSFIGPMHAYVVTERVVGGEDRARPEGGRSAGVKHASLVLRSDGPTGVRDRPDGAGPAARDDAVLSYVESRVVRALTDGSPPLERVVEVRLATLDDVRRRVSAGDPLLTSGPGCLVSEHVQRA
jgi:hypothetical protein